jgi:cysteinyl-tRNA synthetase
VIRLYNSYTRELEEFIPLKSREVSMYTCGPTVYDKAHIGNLRTAFFSDLVARVLKFNGYYVKSVMNITDLDDKIENTAKELGKPALEITKFYTDYYLDTLKKLNINLPWKLTKATDYISEMQFLIRVLLEKGIAYQTEDGIYFNISKFPQYYQLSNQDPAKIDRSRIEENPNKINPHDFALWKFSKSSEKRLLEFDSPWGKGYPGWHIECSAMSLKELGDTIDIHIGGEDLKMTHHPNEIAQSECVTGEKFVNYWLHGAFLNINSEKMSKSLGNFYVLDDLIKDETNPIAVRYYFLSSTYRNPLNFTDEGYLASKNALKRAYDIVASLKVDDSYKYDEVYVGRFLDAINNDFNTPAALGIFWETVTSNLPETIKLNSLLKMDEVLGLDLIKYVGYDIPLEVLELAKLRWEYKRQGIYDKADFMRRDIEKLGFEVLDQKDSYQLKKVFK